MHIVRTILLSVALGVSSVAYGSVPPAEENFTRPLNPAPEYEEKLAIRAYLPYLWEDSVSAYYLCVVGEVARSFGHPVLKKDLWQLMKAATDYCEEVMIFFKETYRNASPTGYEEDRMKELQKERKKTLERWIKRYSK
jgi:hypothetical protein